MKIAHLHIARVLTLNGKEETRDKSTLVAQVKDGYIDYTLWGGWTSDGTRFSLANLGTRDGRKWGWTPPLPVTSKGKTKEEFVKELIGIINDETFYTVLDEVKPVSFAG